MQTRCLNTEVRGLGSWLGADANLLHASDHLISGILASQEAKWSCKALKRYIDVNSFINI